MGTKNCGTQLKLSTLLTCVIFAIIALTFIENCVGNRNKLSNLMKYIGDILLGIYFLHLAVMTVLEIIPFYSNVDIFPIDGLITLAVSIVCIIIGKAILGRYGKYLAL